jgi:hypothetical protein
MLGGESTWVGIMNPVWNAQQTQLIAKCEAVRLESNPSVRALGMDEKGKNKSAPRARGPSNLRLLDLGQPSSLRQLKNQY